MTNMLYAVLVACAVADEPAEKTTLLAPDLNQTDTAVVEAEQLASNMSDILAMLQEIPTVGETDSVPIKKVVTEEKK